MTSTHSASVLSQMGFTVCSETRGVYHLRRLDARTEAQDSVALFYCPGPVDQVNRIRFFEFAVGDLPDKATMIPRIIQHWGTLDARRIEDSGIAAYVIERADFGTVIDDGLVYERPDTDRVRRAVRMSSGEALCFN